MYKLLIADDEAIERAAIIYFILQAGLNFARISEAGNGIEAVELAKEFSPEIIVMDVRMPGKDGLVAAKEIRQFNPTCKIIFLTAFSEFDYAQQAIKIKAEDFIIKPAYSETLIEVMQKVIVELELERPAVRAALLDATAKTATQCVETSKTTNSPAVLLIQRVCTYIDEHYQEDIRLEELCEMVGFSKCYFSRIFKQYEQMSVVDYITRCRLEKTKQLLLNPRLSVKEISGLVGYHDANYLTAVFKKWEKISPTDYRAVHVRLGNKI